MITWITRAASLVASSPTGDTPRDRQKEGLEGGRTNTIKRVLEGAGSSYRRTRSWCPTGTAQRVRKSGTVIVLDPDATPKKLDRGGVYPGRAAGVHRRGNRPCVEPRAGALRLGRQAP